MKLFSKNKSIVLFFIVALPLFASCGKPPGIVVKESEYPPVSDAIMQSTITYTDNSTATLGDKRGKVLLVNFWATWCGPCRTEMPHLDDYYKTYKDRNVEVIGINASPEEGENLSHVAEFAKEIRVSYPLVKSDQSLFLEFLKVSQFEGIPQTFLIGRDGRLRAIFLGGGPSAINNMRDALAKAVAE
jgi:thiol-disulfide isomerase/thioredoxin